MYNSSKSYLVLISVFIITQTLNGQTSFWSQSEFPFIYNKNIISIAARNNNIFAAGDNNGGTGISTDGGEHWSFAGVPGLACQNVTISKSGYLFAINNNATLYRSTNGGSSWTSISLTQNFYPNNVVCSEDGYVYIGSQNGVYRSTDNGLTWTQQNNGIVLGSTMVVRVAISSNGILAAATNENVYKSTDNAESWTQISSVGASNIAVNSLGYVYANKYSVNPYLYIDSLYVTRNNGVSWQGLKQWEGNLIYINPVDDDILLCDYNYYDYYLISKDNGLSWNKITFSPGISCVSYNGNGQYYLGSSNEGIFISNSLAGPWQISNNGFPGASSQITCIHYENGEIYAGAKSAGPFVSLDGGKSYYKASPGLSPIKNLCATPNGNLLAAFGGALEESQTNGNTWSYISNYKNFGVLYGLSAFSLFKSGNIILAGGLGNDQVSGEIDRSTDGGNAWSKVFTIPGTYGLDKHNVITLKINNKGNAIGCVKNDTTYQALPGIWGDKYSYDMIRSTDYGQTWVGDRLITPEIRDFAWNTNNEVFAASANGLLMSKDNGASWTNVSGSLPSNNILCITISSNNNIYIGTANDGAFVSTNDGYSWNAINVGLKDTVVNALTIGEDGYLYAGTEYGGIFKSNSIVDSTYLGKTSIPVFPKNYSSGIPRNVQLKWSKINGIVTYSLQISKDSTFQNISKKYTGLTDTVKNVDSLDNSTKYYWRVQTSGSNGINQYQFWSQVFQFRTANPIAISNPYYPINNSIGVPLGIELRWAKAPSTASYGLQFSTDSTFKFLLNNYNGIKDTAMKMDSLAYSTKYYWRIKTIDSLGYGYWSQEWRFTTLNLPSNFNLYQNYPNPFNPITKIEYDISQPEHVSLKIFDMLGREIATIVNEDKPAGSYKVEFNGSNLSSGIYFYKIYTGNYSSVRKMILLK